ncbi:MAG: hypothetical protein HOB32_00430 [Nitrospina sp.]|nr:hypothetical protein [Nitrospina sp.]
MTTQILTASKTNKGFLFYLCFLFFTIIVLLLQEGTAEALCIKDKKANLRSGPGKHNEKLWTVLKYMPLRQLGRQGNWLKVKDLDSDIYWVHRKLTTKAYMCAVIKKDKTSLRKKPSMKSPQVEWSPINKFFSMKVIKIKGAWVSIQDATGDRAWIKRSQVWVQ